MKRSTLLMALLLLSLAILLGTLSPLTLAGDRQSERFEDLHQRAQAELKAGDYATAVRQYRKALALKPDHAEARFEFAQAFAGAGKYFDARRNYRLALSARATDPVWVSRCRLELARCWEAGGNYREALWEYQLALKADPSLAEARTGERRTLAAVNSSDGN
jgi:tetratricopeptide (TPR) repeat protein